MLKAWILSLRRKPKAVRERVAFAAAAGVSAFIFAIWAATIPFRLLDQATQPANVFGGLVDSVKNEFDAPKQEVPATNEEPPSPLELEWKPIATTSTDWWSPEPATTTDEQPRAIRIATTTSSSTAPSE